MNSYKITISQNDLPFVLSAITLRAEIIQDSIRLEIKEIEEEAKRKEEEARRAALPDPFESFVQKIEAADFGGNEVRKKLVAEAKQSIEVPKEVLQVSKAQLKHAEAMATKRVPNKQKQAILLRFFKGKESKNWSTAEIARQANVSYATAHKARKAFEERKSK